MPVDAHASKIGLHMAAMCGDVQVVHSLLDSKDPPTDIESRDTLGDSGLLKASRYGHLQVVEALLAAGANLNTQDNKGWTCLHVSIANNHEGVFFMILRGANSILPANIEAVTLTGDTPLHMAAYHGRAWAVGTLLRLGADRTVVNHERRRPIDVTRHDTVRSMLAFPNLTWCEEDECGGGGPTAGVVEVLDTLSVGGGVSTLSSIAGFRDAGAGELGGKGVDAESKGDNSNNWRDTKNDLQHGDVHDTFTSKNRHDVVFDENPRVGHPGGTDEYDSFQEESSDGTHDNFNSSN